MKKSLVLIMSAVGLLVAGCMQDQPAVQEDQLTAAVSGKTLTAGAAGETVLFVDPNGTLSGKGPEGDVVGTWEVRNGQWCRTITAPVAWVGSQCQPARLRGNILTLPSADGSNIINWRIE